MHIFDFQEMFDGTYYLRTFQRAKSPLNMVLEGRVSNLLKNESDNSTIAYLAAQQESFGIHGVIAAMVIRCCLKL